MKHRSGQAVVFALLLCFIAAMLIFALQREPAPRTRPFIAAPPDSPPAVAHQQGQRGTPVLPPRYPPATSLPDREASLRPTYESQHGRPPVALPTPDVHAADVMNGRWRLWFPHWPSSTAAPVLRSITLGAQGETQQHSWPEIALGLQPSFPGPSLYRLHPSPNRRLWVAEIAYGEQVYPVVLDLRQGKVYTPPGEQAYFYAWHPDGRRVLLSAVEGWLLADAISRRYELFTLFDAAGVPLPVRAVAYSPDGRSLAEASLYPPTVAEPTAAIEVGLWRDGQRASLLRLVGGSMVAEHSLRWSPDGDTLALIADVHGEGRQTQLWTIDTRSRIPTLRGVLAREEQYNHPPAWSPDGRSIAALARSGADEAFITIFDVNDGGQREIRPRTGGSPSHLFWSKDGRWLLFSLERGGYSEVWITSPDGVRQQALAGPLPAGAPFALIEDHE
jgi:WD40 repeat protein